MESTQNDITITLDPQGETVTIKLTAYLGDRFSSYRDACSAVGARYVPSEKCNRVSVDATPDLLNSLSDNGLTAGIDKALADRIAAQADEATALLQAGKDRVEATEKALADKGLSLFNYQRTGVQWLAPRKAALITDEMGLGKTVQVLIALPEEAAAVVVVPAALKYNWAAETRRWRSDLEPTVITSSVGFRWPSAGEVIIVSYGALPGEIIRDEKTRKPSGVNLESVPVPGEKVYLIADECHALKNRKAQRTLKFQALAEQVTAFEGVLWGITGTPLLNRPPELWSIFSTFGVAERAFGNWYSFCRIFRGSKGSYGYEWGTPTAGAPDALRKVALRRNRIEVLRDLPVKIHREIVV
jgi:SWI/SNF-related matrix-associated actin-dependent regulator 1 of chromatin subfamily A